MTENFRLRSTHLKLYAHIQETRIKEKSYNLNEKYYIYIPAHKAYVSVERFLLSIMPFRGDIRTNA